MGVLAAALSYVFGTVRAVLYFAIMIPYVILYCLYCAAFDGAGAQKAEFAASRLAIVTLALIVIFISLDRANLSLTVLTKIFLAWFVFTVYVAGLVFYNGRETLGARRIAVTSVTGE